MKLLAILAASLVVAGGGYGVYLHNCDCSEHACPLSTGNSGDTLRATPVSGESGSCCMMCCGGGQVTLIDSATGLDAIVGPAAAIAMK